MAAAPFNYEENLNDRQKETFRRKTRKANKDTLYSDTCNGREHLSFQSSHAEGWKRVIKETFPELQETLRKDRVILTSKSNNGDIHLFRQGTFVVFGQIQDEFEEKFTKMKEQALEPSLADGLAAMNLGEGEREGEGGRVAEEQEGEGEEGVEEEEGEGVEEGEGEEGVEPQQQDDQE